MMIFELIAHKHDFYSHRADWWRICPRYPSIHNSIYVGENKNAALPVFSKLKNMISILIELLSLYIMVEPLVLDKSITISGEVNLHDESTHTLFTVSILFYLWCFQKKYKPKLLILFILFLVTFYFYGRYWVISTLYAKLLYTNNNSFTSNEDTII